MFIDPTKQPVRAKSSQTKLHTLHAVLRGRVFDGKFEVAGKTIGFGFVPHRASLVEGKLVLNGRIDFILPKQTTRYVDDATATLIATQGGIGVSPVRRQLLTGTAQTAQTATSDQKLEQEKGPETDLQPGLHSFESPKYDELGRPRVESTDQLAFVGVLYFKLSPIDNQALGISIDLSDVQLGGRLAPTDDLARDLQLLFSDIVMKLNRESDDAFHSLLDNLNAAFRS